MLEWQTIRRTLVCVLASVYIFPDIVFLVYYRLEIFGQLLPR